MQRSTPALVAAAALVLAACAQTSTAEDADRAKTEAPTSGPAATTDRPTTGPSKAAQRRLDERLRAAAWKNDVAAARRLIGRGASVNAHDDTRQSAYLIATSEGHLDLLRLALKHGADVSDLDGWNGTGLIRAAERGHANIVGELLSADVPRDHVNRIGYQAIHEAVWLGRDSASYLTTVRALYAGGVEFDRASTREGLTPLQMAERRGHRKIERSLRSMTTQKRPATAGANKMLLDAATRGDADRVAVALRAGADIETRDARDRTALLLAVTHDRVAAARVLVALGADPDALDSQHDTPWLVTGVTGSVAMLETLLPARPDLTIKNRYGGLSVIPASERGHADYVRRVVKTDIDVNHVNDLGWTALLEAVILGDGGRAHQDIVRTLLAHGADRSIADRDGVTALQHAERHGYREIAAILRRE